MLGENFASIRLISLDVDGVLTDGRLYFSSTGEELKSFNVKDGTAIQILLARGYDVVLLSASENKEIIERRAKALGIDNAPATNAGKLSALERYLSEKDYGLANVCHVGDDITDLEVLLRCRLPVCPADAVVEVRAVAKLVLNRAGGEGCVRELLDTLGNDTVVVGVPPPQS